MDTLPDFLAPGLRLISVGLNPSLPSVRDGYYFSGRTNRFWPVLNASSLLSAPIEPSPRAMQHLLEVERIGFTDSVKRPTAGAGDLRAADFRRDVPGLLEKLQAASPGLVWFHGKVAFRNVLRYGSGQVPDTLPWGLQSDQLCGLRVVVTPNPSAANAVYSRAALTNWFNRVAELI